MKKEFLMLSDLANRWQCSTEYLHELIRQGNLIPSIRLSEQERYVGGEFVGGICVGDVGGAVHKSYNELYVSCDPEAEDYHESWPQCAPVVFCHCPEIESEGRYSFQFVSEVVWPGLRDKWFYLDGNRRITSDDAERRFRFELEEVERIEVSEASEAEIDLDGEVTIVGLSRRTISSQGPRIHALSAEIDHARQLADDSDDPHSVWPRLLKLADEEFGCMLAAVDGTIKYMDGGNEKYYTFGKLSNRLRQARRRKK